MGDTVEVVLFSVSTGDSGYSRGRGSFISDTHAGICSVLISVGRDMVEIVLLLLDLGRRKNFESCNRGTCRAVACLA